MFTPTLKVVLLKLVGLAFAIFLSGCLVLPVGVPLEGEEKIEAIRQFKKNLYAQGQCSCCFDADVSISFKKLFGSATIPGYLQGREPSFLKFEGVNPLGMTEIVAGLQGDSFHLVNVRQKRVYLGAGSSAKVKKFIPAPFVLQYPFYWLTGRIPPGSVTIFDVKKDVDDLGFWVELSYDNVGLQGRVLFDSTEGAVLQNILIDADGAVLVRFMYEYDRALTELESGSDSGFSCLYPNKISMDENGNGAVFISIKKTYYDVNFSEKDFETIVPRGFKREIIQ